MKVENPVALRYILQDELYLLGSDKPLYAQLTTTDHALAAAIVEPGQQQPAVAPAVIEVKTQQTDIKYMGKNQKNFLVLVHYPELEFIDEAHLQALVNIIKRKELTIDDLAIVNLAGQGSTEYQQLLNFFKPARVLILGKNALPPGISALALNSPASLAGVNGLYSYSFAEMMDNVEYKKAFWEQMKGF